MGILLVVGLALLIAVFRYVFYKITDKGTDALTNTYKRMKNAKEEDKTENLSDRYL